MCISHPCTQGLMKVRDDEAKDKMTKARPWRVLPRTVDMGEFDLGEEKRRSDLEYGEKKDTGTEEGAADEENQAGRSRSRVRRNVAGKEAPSDAAKSDTALLLVGATTDLTHMRIISVVLVLLIVILLLTVNDPDVARCF